MRQINELHSRLFAEFLVKMKNTPDGDSNLLDQSMIVYGSGLADGNGHTHDQLPTLLAGRGGGFVTPGRHIIYQRETPVTNLFATMIERIGVRAEHVGDSTGRLADLSLTLVRRMPDVVQAAGPGAPAPIGRRLQHVDVAARRRARACRVVRVRE